MTGPQQFPLFDDGNGHMSILASRSVLDHLADAVGLMPDDHGNLMTGNTLCEIHGIEHHRLSRDRM